MRLLLFNVCLHASVAMHIGQMERAAAIVRRLRLEQSRYDALVLTEVFHDGALGLLRDGLAEFYPHSARIPRDAGAVVSGGVVVFSKRRMSRTAYHVFRSATGADRLAAKGALFVQFGDDCALVATHMQAWDGRTRALQGAELGGMINAMQVRVPLLVAGDLNWNLLDDGERREMLHATAATQVSEVLGERRHSVHAAGDMYGLDGSKDANFFCKACWSGGDDDGDPGLCARSCPRPDATPQTAPVAPPKLLDYAYVPYGFPRAHCLTARVLDWQSDVQLRFPVNKWGWVSRPTMHTRDLSDHHPVEVEWVCSPPRGGRPAFPGVG